MTPGPCSCYCGCENQARKSGAWCPACSGGAHRRRPMSADCTCTELNRRLMALQLHVEEGEVHEEKCRREAHAAGLAQGRAEEATRIMNGLCVCGRGGMHEPSVHDWAAQGRAEGLDAVIAEPPHPNSDPAFRAGYRAAMDNVRAALAKPDSEEPGS